METKLIMLYDNATEMPVMASRASEVAPSVERVLARAGFGKSLSVQREYVILTSLSGNMLSTADPYSWGDRTRRIAHKALIESWDKFANGSSLDVREYIDRYSALARV